MAKKKNIGDAVSEETYVPTPTEVITTEVVVKDGEEQVMVTYSDDSVGYFQL